MSETVVITGAFSYTGKYAARLLLHRGHRIRTLTNHPPAQQFPRLAKAARHGAPPDRTDPFRGQIEVFPYNFDHPDELCRSLEGASALINTYWVRFPHGGLNFETAVQNSRMLIKAARDAGVQRIVHVSIANPSLDSPLGYYRGKAQVEQAVRDSGISYAILRPTVIFGTEDILINNVAWFVRRFPVFAIPGDGCYAIRPIYVEDMARLLADAVDQKTSTVLDAVGPETLGFEELVRLVAQRVGRVVRIVRVPMSIAYLSTLVVGWLVRDVVLTWEEYAGLTSNLLAPDGPSAGQTCLSQWLVENGSRVGKHYASEVGRHYAKTPVRLDARSAQEGGRHDF